MADSSSPPISTAATPIDPHHKNARTEVCAANIVTGKRKRVATQSIYEDRHWGESMNILLQDIPDAEFNAAVADDNLADVGINSDDSCDETEDADEGTLNDTDFGPTGESAIDQCSSFSDEDEMPQTSDEDFIVDDTESSDGEYTQSDDELPSDYDDDAEFLSGSETPHGPSSPSDAGIGPATASTSACGTGSGSGSGSGTGSSSRTDSGSVPGVVSETPVGGAEAAVDSSPDASTMATGASGVASADDSGDGAA